MTVALMFASARRHVVTHGLAGVATASPVDWLSRLQSGPSASIRSTDLKFESPRGGCVQSRWVLTAAGADVRRSDRRGGHAGAQSRRPTRHT